MILDFPLAFLGDAIELIALWVARRVGQIKLMESFIMSHARLWFIMLVVTVEVMACLWKGQGDDESAEADGADAASVDHPTPADVERMEQEFAKTMSGATLVGFATYVRAGTISRQIDDEYRLGEVIKVDDERWSFQYSSGERLYKTPSLQVRWVAETPVIIFSEIKMKGRPGTFSARLLIDDDQYSGTWSDGKSGGHMFGMIVHEKPKKGRKAKESKEDDKET